MKPVTAGNRPAQPRRYLSGFKNRWEPVESRYTTKRALACKKYLAAVAVPKARIEQQKRGSALFVVL